MRCPSTYGCPPRTTQDPQASSKLGVHPPLRAHHDELTTTAPVGVVVGPQAGWADVAVGKTELIVQHARRFHSHYPLIWHIGEEGTHSGLGGLVRALIHDVRQVDTDDRALHWLQTDRGWLLVLDDVEDLDELGWLMRWISGRGKIIVITRLGTAGAGFIWFTPCPVGPVPPGNWVRGFDVRFCATSVGVPYAGCPT
jgi:hypothetical protein